MSTNFDFTKRMSGLQMANPVVVATNGKGEPIVAYVNEYAGHEYAHIRSLYQGRNGEWCPGKGISFLRDEMTDILLRLAERFVVDEPEAAPTIPGVKAKYAPLPPSPTETFRVEGAINKGAKTGKSDVAEAFKARASATSRQLAARRRSRRV